jgi:hypothetical protein
MEITINLLPNMEPDKIDNALATVASALRVVDSHHALGSPLGGGELTGQIFNADGFAVGEWRLTASHEPNAGGQQGC